MCNALKINDTKIASGKNLIIELQVVENWNSANDFIFFGKGREIATNRFEDQEFAM
jgi:TnpA family transposase